jgi:hypothetical protein
MVQCQITAGEFNSFICQFYTIVDAVPAPVFFTSVHSSTVAATGKTG